MLRRQVLPSLLAMLGALSAPAAAQAPTDPATPTVAPTPAPAPPEPAPAPAAQPVAAAPATGPLADLVTALAAWADHRSQTIEVREIKGLEAVDVTESRKLVEERLRTLLTKKRSNREWRDYWAGEERFAGQIAEILDAIAASGTLPPGVTDAAVLRQRKEALAAWAGLARDKQANQDRYFGAISQDVEALEDRLKAWRETASDQEGERTWEVCGPDAEDSDERSPIAALRACVRATRLEIRLLEERVQQARASARLLDTQSTTLTVLFDAQRVDVQLAQQEARIARDEATRSRTGDSARWHAIWADYAARAEAKIDKLREAVHTTRSTQRALGANISFYSTELESLDRRIADTKASLATRSSLARYGKATLSSLWFFGRRAWAVPIYLLFGWILVRLARRGLRRLADRAKGRTGMTRDDVQRVDTLANVTRGALTLVIWVGAGLLALDASGVDIGPILGGAAIFGLAISFGSQSLVKDVVTGFFILLENQYAVGDVIEVGGSTGTVESITLRRTVLRDIRGAVHTIPNGSISLVKNQSQGWARVVAHYGIGYESDLAHVQRVVDETGDAMFAEEAWAAKLTEPPRFIGLTEMADSALMVRVMAKTKTLENAGCERELNRRIKEAFDREGISIPFPQRDVHMVGSIPAPTGAPPA